MSDGYEMDGMDGDPVDKGLVLVWEYSLSWRRIG